MVSKRVVFGAFYSSFSLFFYILGACVIKQLFHSRLLDIRLVIANLGGAVASWLEGGPGSGPGRGHCVVFLGKTLYSHGASLHPGV